MPYTENEINAKLKFFIEPNSNHFHMLPMNSIKNTRNLKITTLDFLSTL